MTTGTPAHADLLCAFANTLDVDVDATVPEALLDAAALTAWLRAQDLIGPDEQADDNELGLARSLRSGLRTAMLRHQDHNHDDDPSPVHSTMHAGQTASSMPKKPPVFSVKKR